VPLLTIRLEATVSNLQGPLSRFGDTAANAGTLALLDSYDSTRGLNVGLKTLAASFSAGLFRIALMPIDACKTILQARSRPFSTHLPPLTSMRASRVVSSSTCWVEQGSDMHRWRGRMVCASCAPRSRGAARPCCTTARWRPRLRRLRDTRPGSAHVRIPVGRGQQLWGCAGERPC